jgi:hypothetical protein
MVSVAMSQIRHVATIKLRRMATMPDRCSEVFEFIQLYSLISQVNKTEQPTLLQTGIVITRTHLTVVMCLCWPLVTVTMRHSSDGRLVAHEVSSDERKIMSSTLIATEEHSSNGQ